MIRGGRRKPSSFFFARDENGREIAGEWRDFQRRFKVPSEKPHPSRSGMDRPSGLSSRGPGRPLKREKAKLTLLTPFSRNREMWAKSSCINTRDSKSYRLNEISRADVITLGNVCVDISSILKLNPWVPMARNAAQKRAVYFEEFQSEAAFITQSGKKFHDLSKDRMILSKISRMHAFDMAVGAAWRMKL